MKKNFSLTNENIDAISQELFEFLQGEKQVKENVIRARLSVETALLQWLEHGNGGRTVTVHCRKRFNRFVVRLEMEGDLCDPRHYDEREEALDFLSTLQGNLGLTTNYKYVRGCNIHDIKLPVQPMGDMMKICLAVAAAFATWQLSFFLPQNVVTEISNNVFDPTFNMVLGLIKTVASFMIFFNLVSAIGGMEDLSTLSKLGGRSIRWIQLHNFIWLMVAVLTGVCVFGVVDLSGGFSLRVVSDIYKVIMGFVPDGLLNPFIDGNILQISFLGICTGVLLLTLNQQTGDLIKIIQQCNVLFMNAISYLCAAVPLVAYFSFVGVLLHGTLSVFLSSWKIVALIAAVCFASVVVENLWCAWKNDFDVYKHFARIMPVSILAFVTASTVACIPLINSIFRKEGVDDNYRDFVLPLSQVFCMPGTIVGNIISVLGLLMIYGQTISLSSLVISMVSGFLLAQTVMPIAGGDISIKTLLILQVGLPNEAVLIYISMSIIVDMLETCCNRTVTMNNIFACAAREGRIKVSGQRAKRN